MSSESTSTIWNIAVYPHGSSEILATLYATDGFTDDIAISICTAIKDADWGSVSTDGIFQFTKSVNTETSYTLDFTTTPPSYT